jgi:hypothetical protein
VPGPVPLLVFSPELDQVPLLAWGRALLPVPKALVPDRVLPLAQVPVLDPVRLQALVQVHLQAVTLAAYLPPRQVLELVQHQVRRRVATPVTLPAPALVYRRYQRVK